MYNYFAKKGYRNVERKALNEESCSYLAKLKDIEYEDAAVMRFVKYNFSTIYSVNIDPYRLERISVRLIASPDPDAFLLPNGVLVLSTGLLCTLDSEDELIAVITNEMCHYLLDHPLNNVMRAENRSRNAAFWGVLLSGVARVAADIACDASYNNDKSASNVSAGLALASGIGSIVSFANVKEVNRLGMNYTIEQDALADSVTVHFLQLKQMNVNALSSSLYKIKNFYQLQGKTKDISRYVSCKALSQRLSQLGGCDSVLVSPDYLKATASVVTSNARMYFGDKRYEYAEQLLQKNIKYNLADSQDYVLLAQCKMAESNTASVNEECLKLLDKANQLSTTTNMDIFRPRIELLKRLDKTDELKVVVEQYADALNNYNNQVEDNQHEKDWIYTEQSWLNSLKEKQ
jgi:predicted Zn-dependent protease